MVDSFNPYAAPQTEVEVSPGVQWASELTPSLIRTGRGLAVIYAGILVMVIAGIGIGILAGLAAGRRGPIAPLAPMTMLLTGGIFLGMLLNFIGQIMCLAVPEESKAKGLLVVSVTIQVLNLVISALNWVLPADVGITRVLIGGIANLLSLVGFVCFVLFMKRLAQFIERPDLAKRAGNILTGLGVIFVAAVLFGFGVIGQVPLLMGAALVMGIAMLVVFVMYANLVGWLRKALRP